MILWPGPSTRAQPSSRGASTSPSIKQPQLDLHSPLHDLGTYRVKAPGRDPFLVAKAEGAGNDPPHGRPASRYERPQRAIQCQGEVGHQTGDGGRSRTTSTPHSSDASYKGTRGESRPVMSTPWPT